MTAAAACGVRLFVGELRQLFRTGRISLVIGGWVALWRPMENFLYEWWPIHRDARLSDRLAAMPVTLRGADAAAGSVA